MCVSGQWWFLAEPARHGIVGATGGGTACPVPAPSDGAAAATAGRDAVPVSTPPLQQGESVTRRGPSAGRVSAIITAPLLLVSWVSEHVRI